MLGPGFITANVDNDAGGIYTYSTAGAQFGYALLWTMIPMAIMLAFAQEISARMGVVTGKGLSDLIREEFGLRITVMMMFGLVLFNFGNVVTEFAGVSSGACALSHQQVDLRPCRRVLVWVLVVNGDYKSSKRSSSSPASSTSPTSSPPCSPTPTGPRPVKDTLRLPHLRDLRNSDYLYLSVGLIGATIAPWQQFYLQASVVDKGTPQSKLRFAQIDAIFGSVFTIIVAGFIVIACAATLFVGGIHNITDAADAARPCGRSPANTPPSSSPSACSMPRSSPPPSFRSPPPTPSARRSASKAASARSSARRQSSTGSTPVFYRRCGSNSYLQRAAGQARRALAGAQRRASARGARVHAHPGEQEVADGREAE